MENNAIIVTLNEEGYFPVLLESLNKQRSKLDEMIVIDAGSTDQSREVENISLVGT